MSTKSGSKVTASTTPGTRVTWGTSMRPVHATWGTGTLFFAKGAQAWVTWDGTTKPVVIARVALVVL